MRELGLVPCQPRPWRPATTIQGQAGPIPDLVNRDFTSETPGQKMVGDITYIPTWEGGRFSRRSLTAQPGKSSAGR
jgi:putative transposase